MSKINLPELPYPEQSGPPGWPGWRSYNRDQMRAYAAQAVRQALAAQEPVAWKYLVNGTHVEVSEVEPPDDAYDAFTLQRLALIPENDHVEGADQQHP